MNPQLVLVHGRSQQGKDADELKREWVEALSAGLAKNEPALPAVDPDSVHLPFYGDALDQMVRGVSPDEAVEVIIRGEGPESDDAKIFMASVFDDVRKRYGITDDDVEAHDRVSYTKKGWMNWPWVQAALRTLDGVPELSAATLALVTNDVYMYITSAAIRKKIDDGVRKAISPGVETVVVGHSLGSVVAYSLLLREGGPDYEGGEPKLRIPLLVTIGSPLAVTAIRDRAFSLAGVGGNRTPSCVSKWFNAYDPRDTVALYPLDPTHFFLNPPEPKIEDWGKVSNSTGSHHGIKGYLGDPEVSQRISTALRPDK